MRVLHQWMFMSMPKEKLNSVVARVIIACVKLARRIEILLRKTGLYGMPSFYPLEVLLLSMLKALPKIILL